MCLHKEKSAKKKKILTPKVETHTPRPLEGFWDMFCDF